MKTLPATDACESLEHLGKEETSSCQEAERFREHFDLKVEKTEEREEKKPSVFDISAECLKPSPAPFPSINIQLQSSPIKEAPACKTAAISSLSKVQCEWILTEATSCITHCIHEGIKETSVRLDGPTFQTSPLKGVELIVREFSTAPLMFNIEFRGSSAALSVLKPHLSQLSAAFHGVNQPEGYAIHRIESSLEDTSPFLFHRKPPAEEGSSL